MEEIIPPKSSAWTDAERDGTLPDQLVSPLAVQAPPPPPWLPAFVVGTLIQHNGWWARVTGYGQNEAGEIGVFVVPTETTKASRKRPVRGDL